MNTKKLFLATTLAVAATGANAATVSRVDVSGNRRMDAESVRILSDVNIGDTVGEARANQIAKKLQDEKV